MYRLLLSLLLAAFAFPAAAQDHVGADDFGPIADGARHLVIELLELDEAQAAAWQALWADHRTAEQPIVQQIKDVQTLIEDEFASGSPDPTTLGLLMIDRRALGEALQDVHVVYVDGFEQLLDEEQARRLRDVRVAERIQKFIPAFQAFELVRR